MQIAAVLALVTQLIQGVRNATAAGRATVTEGDLDRAFAEIDANDDAISEAIRRRRERENQ